MNENLDQLIGYIAAHYEFSEKKYPALKGATDAEIFDFALKHSILHMTKATGKISTEIEALDHGKVMDLENLKTNTAKSLINVLKLAEILGMNGQDLIDLIHANYKK